jgi:DmsE family decaheme c-type cytochrome
MSIKTLLRREKTGPALSLVLLMVPVLALLVAKPGLAQKDEPNSTTTAQREAEGYIGVEKCVKCHEVEGKGYRDSLHSRVWDERTPAAANDCETCHGPGQAHDLDPGDRTKIKNFKTMAPRDVAETCRSCHNREEHALWEGSMHDSRNVTCINCHSVHRSKSEDALLKKASITETCSQCHRDKVAKLQRSAHMPVREGKLECSSCHNQHGSTNVRLLRTGGSVNEFCVSCHAEKRGPFLWEHAPVRENCTSCHDPHGSSSDRMLAAKTPMLCQRCHAHTRHPSTVYDNVAVAVSRSNRIVNRGCVNCHSNIHGSNHPAGMFFQR